jgi:hypothetical protein
MTGILLSFLYRYSQVLLVVLAEVENVLRDFGELRVDLTEKGVHSRIGAKFVKLNIEVLKN